VSGSCSASVCVCERESVCVMSRSLFRISFRPSPETGRMPATTLYIHIHNTHSLLSRFLSLSRIRTSALTHARMHARSLARTHFYAPVRARDVQHPRRASLHVYACVCMCVHLCACVCMHVSVCVRARTRARALDYFVVDMVALCTK
jgi:hypothetical protein